MLRALYERELGKKVCDRTWRRIKKYLNVGNGIPSGAIIRCYAYLRRKHPTRHIPLKTIENYLEIKGFLTGRVLPDCTGEDIYELAQQLSPVPSETTLYRWGKQIGVGFSKKCTYKGEDVDKWVELIISNPRYVYCPRNLRRIEHG
jgi:hypothetical protein